MDICQKYIKIVIEEIKAQEQMNRESTFLAWELFQLRTISTGLGWRIGSGERMWMELALMPSCDSRCDIMVCT